MTDYALQKRLTLLLQFVGAMWRLGPFVARTFAAPQFVGTRCCLGANAAAEGIQGDLHYVSVPRRRDSSDTSPISPRRELREEESTELPPACQRRRRGWLPFVHAWPRVPQVRISPSAMRCWTALALMRQRTLHGMDAIAVAQPMREIG